MMVAVQVSTPAISRVTIIVPHGTRSDPPLRARHRKARAKENASSGPKLSQAVASKEEETL